MKKQRFSFLIAIMLSVIAVILIITLVISSFIFKPSPFKFPSLPAQKEHKTIDEQAMENYATWKNLHYDLKTAFEPEKMQLTATQTTSFINENTKLDEIHFHLYSDSYNSFEKMPSLTESKAQIKKKYPHLQDSDLLGDITIDKVNVNNQDVSFTQENQDLNIKPAQSIQPNTEIKVTLSFSLKIPYSTQRLGFFDDVYSITQWHPLLSKYNTQNNKWDTKPFDPIGETDFVDAADYDVEIQAPEKMVITSSGVDSETTKQDGKQTLKTSLKNARHFVFIASSIFKIKYYETEHQKIRFAYRDVGNDKIKGIDAMAEKFTKAVDFFNKKIYQHSAQEFDIVETGVVGFAMEYSGLVQMGSYDDLTPSTASYHSSIVVHELGHQWFYWNVGSDSYHEACMDEGFTTYITALFFQENFKDNYFNLKSAENRFQSQRHAACDPVSHYHEKGNTDFDYFTTAYNVTTQIMTDLGDSIGRDKLSDILQAYSTTYSYKFGSLKRFTEILESKTSKQTADWFYNAMIKPNYQKNSSPS